MYVVYDPSSDAGSGQWFVANDFDLETIYLGCSNVTEVAD